VKAFGTGVFSAIAGYLRRARVLDVLSVHTFTPSFLGVSGLISEFRFSPAFLVSAALILATEANRSLP